jgi:hypothetical protein
MRVRNRSAGYPLRSAAQNWCSAAADLILTPPRVALPAVRNHVLSCSNYIVDLGGAKRARTADLLHAIWRQHVHPRPSVQVTVLPRPRTSVRVRVSCCTSVLYRCHPRSGAPVVAPDAALTSINPPRQATGTSFPCASGPAGSGSRPLAAPRNLSPLPARAVAWLADKHPARRTQGRTSTSLLPM